MGKARFLTPSRGRMGKRRSYQFSSLSLRVETDAHRSIRWGMIGENEGASRKLLSLGSNSMKPRICFLDIDGPIINAGCFGISKDASEMRSIMSTSAIGFFKSSM